MRLSQFYQLSAEEQKIEVEKAKKEIALAYEELCRKGVWNENSIKELKDKGETVLWEANK